MKKTSILVGAFLMLALIAGKPVLAESHDDIQAIKKAVKENPAYEPGNEVKWFKILITNTQTGKEKVKVTLPMALVDAFVKCAGDKPFRIHDEEMDIDFRALVNELKKVGPMALIEVYEDDETVKVWLE